MSDWKEESNKRRDFRQGKNPDPSRKGDRPKASKKKHFKLEKRYTKLDTPKDSWGIFTRDWMKDWSHVANRS